ncbi:MAG: class I SAM-dependent methyltransferase [Thermoplasmatota archaeon]
MYLDRRKVFELGEVKNKNVLDIGVGKLAIIAAKDFDCRVTSIDISRSAIEEEKIRVKKENLDHVIKLEKEDATELSYSDDKFDIVISYGALHHNPPEKRERFVQEACRVAKEKVLITEFKEEHHIHPKDVHPPVDHDWLESTLKKFGRLKIYEGEEKILYICFLLNKLLQGPYP